MEEESKNTVIDEWKEQEPGSRCSGSRASFPRESTITCLRMFTVTDGAAAMAGTIEAMSLALVSIGLSNSGTRQEYSTMGFCRLRKVRF